MLAVNSRHFSLLTSSLRTGLIGARMPPATVWIPASVVSLGMILPVVYLSIRTFGAGEEAWDLIFRSRTLYILLRSLLLVATVTAASVAIALPLAWLTVRTDLPYRRLWSVLTTLPLVIPSYIAAFLVIVSLGPKGMLQQGLDWVFGLERLPDIYGFPGALLTLTLLSFPYVLLTVRAALWRLDPSLEEASRSLHHSSWITFLKITLPQLRPSIAAGALLVGLYTLSDFGAVSLLQYETFTSAIFTQYQSALDRTIAAALSLVLVLVALTILVGEARTRARFTYYRSTGGVVRPPSLIVLGKWKWPALGFCALIVLFSLFIPVSILLYWVIRGLYSTEPFSFVWGATWNSLYVSGLASLTAVIAALPVAVLVVRYPSRVSGLIERFSYIGFALPGITIALALVFFGANYATPIYQTLILLIFAYVVLFLPTALGNIRASLLQVSPKLEEAGRGLGRTQSQVFRTITVPLLRPGILAGAALVFLLTMKELPATLVLGPLGFETLATSIWAATNEALFAQAAVPALLLILVSSVPMGFLVLREQRLR